MARIRTVKPELFKHEDLFDLEQQSHLPVRLAFIGLFTCCDREGRFKWRPRTLKADIFPHDELDFSRVLDALATRGFVVRYRVDGEEFGAIPTFGKHQIINNRESESYLPAPDESSIESSTSTCESRVNDASSTPLKHAQVEGKGREGKESAQDASESFVEFWDLYPKKLAKTAALKAWKKIKLKDDLLEVILSAVSAWKQTEAWTKNDGQYVPNAATWLNGSRWEDEIPGAANQTSFGDGENWSPGVGKWL